MSRLIDADALERDGWQMSRTVRINKDTMELQTRKPTDFDAIEQRMRGKWIAYDGNVYICSCCGKQIITNPDYIKELKFCFRCGADMRGETRWMN